MDLSWIGVALVQLLGMQGLLALDMLVVLGGTACAVWFTCLKRGA